jgi:hypothetical protein
MPHALATNVILDKAPETMVAVAGRADSCNRIRQNSVRCPALAGSLATSTTGISQQINPLWRFSTGRRHSQPISRLLAEEGVKSF